MKTFLFAQSMLLAQIQSAAPIPRDIPLPLPAPEWLLITLLVVSFILHILFVNLMLGSAVLTLIYEIRGRKQPEYDGLAYEIARTITVNKSLAVVLGVAPLLSINVLYTMHFYTANALTGTAWILLIPMIILTFLLLYAHKYSWEKLREHKGLHISMIAAAVLLFLMIPLVFLANVNLMLFPEKWLTVKGFFSALLLPNVFPRYFHFLCASLAITGLFLVWYVGRKQFNLAERLPQFEKNALRKQFYSLAFGVSVAQFTIGPLVLFTLPERGISAKMVVTILSGAVIALPALWYMWKEITSQEANVGQHLYRIAGLFSLVVVAMASGRHLYREEALADHRTQMKIKTEAFERASVEALKERMKTLGKEHPNVGNMTERKALALQKGECETCHHPVEWNEEMQAPPMSFLAAHTDLSPPIKAGASHGETVFVQNCGACHAVDKKLIGPPLTEIAQVYNEPNGIVTWAKAPGKKRPDYPQMPAFAHVPETDLKAVGEYMLQAGKR
ncbi:MAG: cytochrome c [Ignavibacteria bacterium]|nr:cytochrome c [Ignavibacteria bacterium]